MKIVQIVQDFPPYNMAGVEIYSYNLSKYLSENHEVFVFHRYSDLSQKEYKIKYNKIEDIHVYGINNTFKNCYSFKNLYQNKVIDEKFHQLIKSISPDVVHIQHLIFLSLGLIRKVYNENIPLLYTLHDYWLICPQWHFLDQNWKICKRNNYYKCAECLKNKLQIKKTPKKIFNIFRSYIPSKIMPFLQKFYCSLAVFFQTTSEKTEELKIREEIVKKNLEKINLFLAPSRFIERKYIDFGIPREKIKYCDYGIDINLKQDYFNYENSRSKNFKFGFVGTILPAKGLHVLIKAFRKLNKKNVVLKIFGRLYPYKGFENYPNYIKKLGNEYRIKFLGGFSNEKVGKIFSEIDVLIVPSIWYENSPFVIKEAFLFDTPVIASDIGGIPELVENNKNGLLFKPREIDELKSKMEEVIEKPHLYKRLKKNITTPKSIQQNARELEEIYKSIL